MDSSAMAKLFWGPGYTIFQDVSNFGPILSDFIHDKDCPLPCTSPMPKKDRSHFS